MIFSKKRHFFERGHSLDYLATLRYEKMPLHLLCSLYSPNIKRYYVIYKLTYSACSKSTTN